jgi:pilus assembly protein FimV
MEMIARPIPTIGTPFIARNLRMLLLLSLGMCAHASALTLGEADVRSFSGQALDVRIPIQAGRNEWVDLSCISARAGERGLSPLSTSRFRLEETLDSRTLIIRTHEPIVGPYLALEVTLRCDSQAAATVRSYDLNLPALEATVIIVNQPGQVPQSIAQQTPAGRTAPPAAGAPASTWTTGTGDTLEAIAKGLYPKSARMRVAFIRRLREINPVPLPGDGETLATGLKLNLPNLVALANESPRIVAQSGETPSPAAVSAPRKDAPTRVAPLPAPPSAPARAGAPPAPAAQKAVRPVPPASPVPVPAVVKPVAEKPAAAPRPAQNKPAQPASSGGFSLRLSGAEMDLSRSKGVSEAARSALRDKQLLLDADDQVAALLSLRNTVKQLEGRLNEMHLKLSTGVLPAVPAKPAQTTVAQVEPPAKTAPTVQAPAVVQPAAPEPAPPSPPKAAAPAAEPAAKPTLEAAQPANPLPSSATAPKPAAPPIKASPATASEPETPLWMSPVVLGIGGVLLLVLGWLGWRWAKRGEDLPDAASEPQDERAARSARPVSDSTSDLQGPSSDDLPLDVWDDDKTETKVRARASSIRSGPPSTGLRNALREAEHHETVRLHAPPELMDEGTAALELDTRPATSVDFVLGEDFGEDKSRRRRYMEERFPELAHRSISVDEPDSIIDAARHHYEEGQLQKAIELLTYAFEERPGQLRFWLALFEIHRLEQRATDFAELAARFKNVHSGTDAWPKVQHIGRDLDPGQPLYAAALGRLGVPMDADFDPMSENWLNVPMDFTSDVLMIELRHSLMAEHVVLESELKRPLLEPVT